MKMRGLMIWLALAPLYAQVFGPSISDVRALDEGLTNQVVRGKPFTATEERRSVQVLRDGTRIENAQTNRIFRDSSGRTRVDDMNGTATILDPTTGFRTELNPSTKTARRVMVGVRLPVISRGGPPAPSTPTSTTAETTENLKPQTVNGVKAQGVRTTMTIPKGQIGNDRDIKVVTERWVSSDLQILIKSTNTDPRFGNTIYQITGLAEREPDPALFQIPTDFTVVQEGRGGARSPNPPGLKGARGTQKSQ